MQFLSFNFLLFFLPIVLAIFYLNKNIFGRNLTLIIASFIFYSWGNPLWGALLFTASLVDFMISKRIGVLNQKLESTSEKFQKIIFLQKKVLLIVSLIFNFGLLAFFKYWNWIVDSQNIFNLTNFKNNMAIPAGISFYTFETVSYTIDVYRRKLEPTKKFINYLSFISFFPHLVAGPILRANDLLLQLEKFKKRISSRIAESAFFLISWGLFKKAVIADNLGNLINRCNETPDIAGSGLIIIIAFSFQIYCDFSAYCDIARGVARLFGIKIKRNFLTPYFATNPRDFWQRWHITLSQWVRDYIYIPLGGNQLSKFRNIFNLFLTMILMGLWHGTGKFFIFWGIYHALILIIYRIFPIDKFLLKLFGNFLGKFLATFVMFCFTLCGWLLFWVKSNKEFFQILQSISLISDLSQISNRFYQLSYGLLIFITPIIISDFIGFKYKREFVEMHKFMNNTTKTLIYIALFYAILFFGARGSYDFIYFQF